MSRILTEHQVNESLRSLSGWKYSKGKLKKALHFNSYMDSMDIIMQIAKKAEELNHHPDMIVGYQKIEISFTSHDLGGVTTNCIEMAVYVDSITNS